MTEIAKKHQVIWLPTFDQTHETVAFGRKWDANVPQEIDDRLSYEIEESQRTEDDKGRIILRPVKRRVRVIDMIRTNPCFQIVGEARRPVGRPRKINPADIPNAAEEHGHGVDPKKMIDAEFAIDNELTHAAVD